MALTSSRAVASEKQEWKRSGGRRRSSKLEPTLAARGGAGPRLRVGRSHAGGGAGLPEARRDQGRYWGRGHTRGRSHCKPVGSTKSARGRRDCSWVPFRYAPGRQCPVLPSADGRTLQGHGFAVSLWTPGGRPRAEARLRANGRVPRRAAAVGASAMLCRAACR